MAIVNSLPKRPKWIEETLWENPNPNSNFEQTTLSVNYEGYEQLRFYYKYSTTDNTIMYIDVDIDMMINFNSMRALFGIAYNSNIWARTIAGFNSNRNTVLILRCTNASTIASSNPNNSLCIPTKICGLR